MSTKLKIGAGALLVLLIVTIAVLASESTEQRLTMAVASRSNDVELAYWWVGMTNHGAPVSYRGYAQNSPVYSIVHDRPSGSVTQNLFWCGTGMREVTLRRNEGVQFAVIFYATNAPARIVLNYTYPSLADRLLARAPQFIRAKLSPPPLHSVAVPLDDVLSARKSL
jgi:hypothetical protein